MPAPDPFTQKLYPALCLVLSDRAAQVDWPAFTPDDWQALPALARREGVAPLLYHKLQRATYPVPGAVMDALAAEYYRTAAQNTLLFSELGRILAALDAAGIPVIVLKGAALAQTIYPDPALRPMGDMDLLIPQAKRDGASEMVQGIGYTPADVEIFPGIRREMWHHESLRGGPEKQIGLELHWHLIAGPADDRNVPVEWFWACAETRPGRSRFLQGQMIPQMHPTAHLLYLAAHLSLRHGGNRERLIWFYDANQLVRSGRVDWDAFIRQAQVLGWGGLARYILEGAMHRFGTPLPEGLLFQLSDGMAWETFSSERETRTGRVSRTGETWQRVRYLRRSIQLRWIFALFFPSPAYLHWRYQPTPSWLWPIYYIYRWGDIARDWGLGVFLAWKKKRG